MTTSLHINHRIDDFDSWYTTFSTFDQLRADAGVTRVEVRRGVDDPNDIAVDLEFAATAEARAFLGQLETQIWPSSPHLRGGTPRSQLLETIPAAARR